MSIAFKSLRVLGTLFAPGFVACLGALAHAAERPNPKGPPPTVVASPVEMSEVRGDATIEQGKALFESGQHMPALSKFMAVLRRDPHNPEARKYLRMVVDDMRRSGKGSGQEGAHVSPQAQEEMRQLLRQRSLFTLDLKAIPGVTVEFVGSVAQVSIDTPLLFPEGTSNLQDEGIPVLDRVAAWLKTFGQQPVLIHAYPEELQDPVTNGSLFVGRYSELFHFLSEERKIPAQRFIGADLLASDETQKTSKRAEVSTTTAKIVIETVGSQSALLEGMPATTPRHQIARWLENSIEVSRSFFNPEEGEWVNIDLAALTRTGLREWKFQIVRANDPSTAVVERTGKGNLLKRIYWDGTHHATGSLVPAGQYVCLLNAVDSDGKRTKQEVKIQLARSTVEETVKPVAKREKKRPAKKKPAPPQEAPAPPAASPAPDVAAPAPEKEEEDPILAAIAPPGEPSGGGSADTLIDDSPTPSAPAAEEEDPVQAIWKQKVQFESGQATLTSSARTILGRIGKTLEVYPLQKVRITGFASSSEKDTAGLARRRGEAVRSALIQQYKVDRSRVILTGGKTASGTDAAKVEMSIIN